MSKGEEKWTCGIHGDVWCSCKPPPSWEGVAVCGPREWDKPDPDPLAAARADVFARARAIGFVCPGKEPSTSYEIGMVKALTALLSEHAAERERAVREERDTLERLYKDLIINGGRRTRERFAKLLTELHEARQEIERQSKRIGQLERQRDRYWIKEGEARDDLGRERWVNRAAVVAAREDGIRMAAGVAAEGCCRQSIKAKWPEAWGRPLPGGEE